MQHCWVKVTEAQENHLTLHGAVLFIGNGGTAQEERWHEPLTCISSSRAMWQRKRIHHPAGGWQTHITDVWWEMPCVAAADTSHNHSTEGAPRCELAPCGRYSCTATGKHCHLNGTSTETLSTHPQLLAQHLPWTGRGEKKEQEKAKQKQLFYKAFTFPGSHDANCTQLRWTLL